MRGGGQLRLQTDYLKQSPKDSRTLSNALFQSAAQTYAEGNTGYGVSRKYDPAKDSSKVGAWWVPGVSLNMPPGTTDNEQNTLAQQLFGVKQPVFVRLKVPDPTVSWGIADTHWLTVDHAARRVYLHNPWGATPLAAQASWAKGLGMTPANDSTGLWSMSESDFVSKVVDVTAPASEVQQFNERVWVPKPAPNGTPSPPNSGKGSPSSPQVPDPVPAAGA
jgi:hypothetical protein